MRRLWWHPHVVALCVAIMGVAMAPSSPALASVAPETFITLFGEPGDYIGGGLNRYYHPMNATFEISGSLGSVTVTADGGSHGDWTRLEFAAPYGQELMPGRYDRAQRASFRETGRPGMDIVVGGGGCGSVSGSFVVKEVTKAPTGPVTSLWLTFIQHCENNRPATFGEIRYNVVGDPGVLTIGPRDLRWPRADPLNRMTPAPVIVTNPSATSTTVGAAAIVGGAPSEFLISQDDCSGRVLAARGSCLIWVRYSPQTSGERSATLFIPEMGGMHDVALSGFAYDGATKLGIHETPSEHNSLPLSYLREPSTSRFGLWGGASHVHGTVEDEQGNGWSLSFDAPYGEELVEGRTYTGAVHDAYGTSAPGMDIRGLGRCDMVKSGNFTVHEITLNEWGEAERLSVSFDVTCDEGASRGVFDIRASSPTADPEPSPSPGSDPAPSPSPGSDPDPSPSSDPAPSPSPGPDPDPSPSPDPTEPEPVAHPRNVTLRLRSASAAGKVTATDGAEECEAQVPVVLQRFRDGFRTVARSMTTNEGRFRIERRIRRGRYRIRAVRLAAPDGSTCERAVAYARR